MVSCRRLVRGPEILGSGADTSPQYSSLRRLRGRPHQRTGLQRQGFPRHGPRSVLFECALSVIALLHSSAEFRVWRNICTTLACGDGTEFQVPPLPICSCFTQALLFRGVVRASMPTISFTGVNPRRIPLALTPDVDDAAKFLQRPIAVSRRTDTTPQLVSSTNFPVLTVTTLITFHSSRSFLNVFHGFSGFAATACA